MLILAVVAVYDLRTGGPAETSLADAIPGRARAIDRDGGEGPVRVIDGDTLDIEGERIRLQGLAAPESHEALGAAATAFMKRLLARETVSCSRKGKDDYGRTVAVCRLTDGRDVAESLVRAGLARDCPRYSGGRYARAERETAGSGSNVRASYTLPRYCQ